MRVILTKITGNLSFAIGIVLFLLLAASWVWALKFAPTERNMGEVYRIIYLHVPTAFAAFFAAFVLFVCSVLTLAKRSMNYELRARSAAEIGLIFTILTLMTGSIWGYPTWGTWWTFDARLTTTLILAILYAGYLLLYHSLAPGIQRARLSAALGIMIFFDVFIIYKSVSWWRTLHQPPSLLRGGSGVMSSEILIGLVLAIIVLLAVSFWLLRERAINLHLQEELEALSERYY